MKVAILGDEITDALFDIEGKCQNVWKIGATGDFSLGDGKIIIGEGDSVKEVFVKGWIGTMEKPVSKDIGNGVAVYAQSKMVQEPTFTNIVPAGAQTVAFSYMIGNIEADFLDEENNRISTGRNSIVWTSEEGEALRKWLTEKIKRISQSWYELKRAANVKKITGETSLDDFVSHLGTRDERENAKKLIHRIARDAEDPETAITLANYVVESTEYRSFVKFVEKAGSQPVIPVSEVIAMMKDWQFIEAREVLRLLTGRVYAIKVLLGMIEGNVNERELHGFLERNPWIIEPRWVVACSEATYSKVLRELFPEGQDAEGGDKRFDLVCLDVEGDYIVVEFKKPDVAIGFKELTQVEQYLIKIRELIRSSKQEKRVRGILVYNRVKREMDDESLKSRKDITCFSFQELIASALRLHSDYIKSLETMTEYRPILDKIIPIYNKLNPTKKSP